MSIIGNPLTERMTRRLSGLNKQYFDISTVEPMNNYAYASKELHQAYHHYIKVVSTQIEAGAKYSGKDMILGRYSFKV